MKLNKLALSPLLLMVAILFSACGATAGDMVANPSEEVETSEGGGDLPPADGGNGAEPIPEEEEASPPPPVQCTNRETGNVHEVGETVVNSAGDTYQCQSDGSWLETETAPVPSPEPEDVTPPAEEEAGDVVLIGPMSPIQGYDAAADPYTIDINNLNVPGKPAYDFVFFEGVTVDKPSCHTIMEVTGLASFTFESGSFWAGWNDPSNGVPKDSILVGSQNAKVENGKVQGLAWCMYLHLSTGVVELAEGEKYTPSPAQQDYIDTDNEGRCASDEQPYPHNPFGESGGGNDVVGAPGDSLCITLYWVDVPGERNTVYWFRGPWDEFPYNTQNAQFWIAPQSWTAEDIAQWAINVLGLTAEDVVVTELTRP